MFIGYCNKISKCEVDFQLVLNDPYRFSSGPNNRLLVNTNQRAFTHVSKTRLYRNVVDMQRLHALIAMLFPEGFVAAKRTFVFIMEMGLYNRVGTQNSSKRPLPV